MSEIKPRVDETGVPWCSKECPSHGPPSRCCYDWHSLVGTCIPAIRAMAADAKNWRRVKAMPDKATLEYFGGQCICTIGGFVHGQGDTPEAALEAAGIEPAKEK